MLLAPWMCRTAASSFLSFALHAGWAVEGPLGSDRKLDAGYVSPHITLARSLVVRLNWLSKSYERRLFLQHVMDEYDASQTRVAAGKPFFL